MWRSQLALGLLFNIVVLIHGKAKVWSLGLRGAMGHTISSGVATPGGSVAPGGTSRGPHFPNPTQVGLEKCRPLYPLKISCARFARVKHFLFTPKITSAKQFSPTTVIIFSTLASLPLTVFFRSPLLHLENILRSLRSHRIF